MKEETIGCSIHNIKWTSNKTDDPFRIPVCKNCGCLSFDLQGRLLDPDNRPITKSIILNK